MDHLKLLVVAQCLGLYDRGVVGVEEKSFLYHFGLLLLGMKEGNKD